MNTGTDGKKKKGRVQDDVIQAWTRHGEGVDKSDGNKLHIVAFGIEVKKLDRVVGD